MVKISKKARHVTQAMLTALQQTSLVPRKSWLSRVRKRRQFLLDDITKNLNKSDKV